MQFMSLTKYMYNNADREHVKLNEEIDYITQYIELQKNRLNSNTKVHFNCAYYVSFNSCKRERYH